jgi:hypothetical protein
MSRWLRSAPSYADVEAALLRELSAYSDGERQVPNAWRVELAERDAGKRAADLPRWSASLADRLVEEHRRLGLPAAGLVTVSFGSAKDLTRGRFRVSGGSSTVEPAVVRRPEVVRGRPRLTISAGGQVRHGTPAAAGIDREVLLPSGAFVVGRDQDADLRLHDSSVSPQHLRLDVSPESVRLTDLGTVNGTLVDGVPTAAMDLLDGNRIELGGTTLVFHRDDTDDEDGPDDDGREAGG